MKRIITYLAGTAFVFMMGCQEPIDLTLPDKEPELIVEGYLNDRDYYIPETDLDCFGLLTVPVSQIELAVSIIDDFINIDSLEAESDYFPFNKVRLSTSSNYFSNAAPPAVSGATVKLFEDGNEVETLVEDAQQAGTYRITHDPKVGSFYHLEINALDKFYTTDPEEYKSVPPLIGLEARYQSNFLGDSCAYYMSADTYETPGEGDYYRWMFYINGNYDARPEFISLANDDGIDGICLFELDVYGDELELGDTLTLFQISVSEGYSNFMFSLQNQTAFVGGPFDTPPAPIRGNVNNETTGQPAFGYFTVGGISANAAVVPEIEPEGGCEEEF